MTLEVVHRLQIEGYLSRDCYNRGYPEGVITLEKARLHANHSCELHSTKVALLAMARLLNQDTRSEVLGRRLKKLKPHIEHLGHHVDTLPSLQGKQKAKD